MGSVQRFGRRQELPNLHSIQGENSFSTWSLYLYHSYVQMPTDQTKPVSRGEQSTLAASVAAPLSLETIIFLNLFRLVDHETPKILAAHRK